MDAQDQGLDGTTVTVAEIPPKPKQLRLVGMVIGINDGSGSIKEECAGAKELLFLTCLLATTVPFLPFSLCFRCWTNTPTKSRERSISPMNMTQTRTDAFCPGRAAVYFGSVACGATPVFSSHLPFSF